MVMREKCVDNGKNEHKIQPGCSHGCLESSHVGFRQYVKYLK